MLSLFQGFLLVFEFNIMTDSEYKPVQKCNNFLNDTAEAMSLNKPNKKVDTGTSKMLPRLMKAFNNKRIIQTNNENTPKSSMQERRHTTEFSLKKNVFSNRHSWMRFPTSRLYTIEYKTSPVLYFKTPRNDYYTKIRKIRDYQRIINYVDKMISDRVPLGLTQPMRIIGDYSVDEPAQGKFTTPIQEIITSTVHPDESSEASMLKILATATNRQKINDEDKCKCPDKISEILNSLLLNIKLLVPRFSTTESALKKLPCETIDKLHMIGKGDISSSRNLIPIQVNEEEVSKELLEHGTSLQPYINYDSEAKKPVQGWQSSLSDENISNTIFGLLQQRFVGQKTYFFKSGFNNRITTPPMFIERTEINEIRSTTPKEKLLKYDPVGLKATVPDYEEDNNKNTDEISETVLSSSPIRKYVKYAPLHFIVNTPNNGGDNIRNMSLKRVSSTSVSRVPPVKNGPVHFIATTEHYKQGIKGNGKEISQKVYDESDENDFSTTTNTAEQYLNLDVHSLELLKKKRVSTSMKKDKTIIKPLQKNNKLNALSTKPDIKWYIRKGNSEYRNMFYPIVTTHFLYHRHNSTSNLSLNPKSITTTENTSRSSINNASTVTVFVMEEIHTSPSTETTNIKTNYSKTKTEESDLDFDQKDKDDIHLEELNLDEDFEKAINEDNYQEIDTKDNFSSSMDNILNVQTEKNVVTIAADKAKEDVLYTSNALHIKPRSYLEIQRDYLQHDEDDDIFLKQFFEHVY